MPQWKPYRHDADYSYTLGAFPTFELLDNHPEQVQAIYMQPSFAEQPAARRVISFAEEHGLELQIDAKTIRRLSPKDNCYLLAVFAKYDCEPKPAKSNLVLVSPSDTGNLGTIMRAMLGFALRDLVIIRPAVDPFDPRVIRSSMGAIFSLNFAYYDQLQDYLSAFPLHMRYPFMLDGQYTLEEIGKQTSLADHKVDEPFSLIFGNEAAGLDPIFHQLGSSVVIPHEPAIDSLNLPLAVVIALHEFYQRRGNTIK